MCKNIKLFGVRVGADSRLQTHSEYVMLIAFPLQKMLRKCVLMLRLCEHCLSCLK